MGGGDAGNEEIVPSDFDPSLPDNDAEAQAAQDARSESLIEKTYSDTKAQEGADSVMRDFFSGLFGGKKNDD